MGSCAPSVAPGWIPDWVFCPRDKIISVVASWIVDGILVVVETLTGVALQFWNVVRAAFGAAGNDVFLAMMGVASVLESIGGELRATLFSLAWNAGLAGPVAAVFVFVAAVVMTLALLRGLLAVIRRLRIWVI